MVVFVLLAGHRVYRLLVPPLVIVIGVVMLTVFPLEINLLVQHAANPAGLLLRRGAWQTAMNIIAAYPLTGIGLGMKNYLQRAEAYRVPAEYTPLAHPHNSYLELGAMAGLPVLLVFLALLLFALWQAWRNWKQANAGMRCLLGGGIAAIVALSVNSLSINAWTLPPIATIGWLVLGSIASPLIARTGNRRDDNVNTL
jgi:O-antigen ligase